MSEFKKLTSLFRQLGVARFVPGFYDDRAFVRAERSNPALLERYADFVRLRPHTDDYLARAEQVVRGVAGFLVTKLLQDGRLGACVDAALTLSRFLEQEGVWNYVAAGALAIHFSGEPTIPDAVFSPIMQPGNSAVTGHAWVVAPPFNVIDVTAGLQPYEPEQASLVPTSTLILGPTPGVDWSPNDLFDADALAQFMIEYGRSPTKRDILRLVPGLDARIARLGVVEARTGRCHLVYTPCAITAPDCSLELARNLILSGRTPQDLYDEYVSLKGPPI